MSLDPEKKVTLTLTVEELREAKEVLVGFVWSVESYAQAYWNDCHKYPEGRNLAAQAGRMRQTIEQLGEKYDV